jgi:hypothetical protein
MNSPQSPPPAQDMVPATLPCDDCGTDVKILTSSNVDTARHWANNIFGIKCLDCWAKEHRA